MASVSGAVKTIVRPPSAGGSCTSCEFGLPFLECLRGKIINFLSRRFGVTMHAYTNENVERSQANLHIRGCDRFNLNQKAIMERPTRNYSARRTIFTEYA